jgi:hypothetical protein
MLAVVITTLFLKKGKKPSILYLSSGNSELESLPRPESADKRPFVGFF